MLRHYFSQLISHPDTVCQSSKVTRQSCVSLTPSPFAIFLLPPWGNLCPPVAYVPCPPFVSTQPQHTLHLEMFSGNKLPLQCLRGLMLSFTDLMALTLWKHFSLSVLISCTIFLSFSAFPFLITFLHSSFRCPVFFFPWCFKPYARLLFTHPCPSVPILWIAHRLLFSSQPRQAPSSHPSSSSSLESNVEWCEATVQHEKPNWEPGSSLTSVLIHTGRSLIHPSLQTHPVSLALEAKCFSFLGFDTETFFLLVFPSCHYKL